MDSPGSPEEPLSARLPIYRSMISLRTFSSGEDGFLDTQPLVDETASSELTRRSRSISWKEVLWPQVAALLWLVPTVTLLVLNIRGYVSEPANPLALKAESHCEDHRRGRLVPVWPLFRRCRERS